MRKQQQKRAYMRQYAAIAHRCVSGKVLHGHPYNEPPFRFDVYKIRIKLTAGVGVASLCSCFSACADICASTVYGRIANTRSALRLKLKSFFTLISHGLDELRAVDSHCVKKSCNQKWQKQK